MSMREHCNNCSGKRRCVVLFELRRPWEEGVSEAYNVNGEDQYRVLECAGCEGISFVHTSWFSEITEENGDPVVTTNQFPPETFRPEPKWMDRLDEQWHITKLLREVYIAIQQGATAIAAMGIRAIIEAMMIEKVGDQGSFRKNLEACKKQGLMSASQEKVLGAALEIGHASIHRGFIPSKCQLETAMDILESLIQTWHLFPGNAAAVIRNVPRRKP